jgi:hypothetical protein
MNAIKILVLIFILSGASLSAGESNNVSELSKKVKRSLSVPESMKQKGGCEKVTIYFMVNEKGDVIEVNARTSDKLAKDDLEKQFIRMNFKGLAPCLLNSIDINFVTY